MKRKNPLGKWMLVFFSFFLWTAPTRVGAAVNPTQLKLKVYQIAVAETTSCTNPVVIFSSASGEEKDFLLGPVLGGGNIPDGTYHCIIITMSDIIRFIPAANDGTRCVAGTEYYSDVCRSDNPESSDQLTGVTSTLINCAGANPPTATNIVDNKVSVYIHSDGRNTGSSFRRGTSNGIQLVSPFVVSGSSTGTFVVNAQNKVADNGSYCEMDAPTFGFR